MKFIIFRALFICLLSVSFTAYAELAGHVIIAKGSVSALDESGQQRALKRRSKFFSGDTIITDKSSQVQLRFTDKALMTLKANSELNISAYKYAQDQGSSDQDKVLMQLVKGGFRTITGQVGKGDKSAYKINTPAASIGIRGTNFEVQQESDDVFVMAVYSGGIRVENSSGTLDLGLDADYNYVRVSPSTSPKGLLSPPASLSSTSINEEEDDSSSEENSEEEKSNQEDSDNEENESETESASNSENSENQSNTNTESSSLADTSGTASTINNALDQTLTEEVTQSVAEDEEIKELLAQLDDIDNIEDLADFLNEGNTVSDATLFDFDDPYANIDIKTSQLAALLTDKEYSLLESQTLVAIAIPSLYDANTLTLDGGPIAIVSPDSISMTFSPSFSEATILFHFKTLNNPEGIDIPVVVGSNLGGSDIVDAINSYLVENPEGISIPFQAVMIPFDSDGDEINDSYKLGFEQICNSACSDHLTEIAIYDVASSSSTSEKDELIALLGGLDGENSESRAELDNQLILGAATWSEATDGLIMLVNQEDENGESEGPELVNPSVSSDITIVTNTTELQNCQANQQACTIKVEKVDGLSNVSWGAWLADPDNPITLINLANGEVNNETQFMAFWIAAEPANINQLSGTANFSASDVCSDFSNCLGFTDDGIVKNFSGNFDVDFNSGAVTNGNINFQSGPLTGTGNQSTWDVNFSGQMTVDPSGTRQPGFQTDSLNGSVSNTSGTLTNNIQGEVGGLFVKPGDSFVGGYNVIGVMDDGNHKKASGLFKLDKQ